MPTKKPGKNRAGKRKTEGRMTEERSEQRVS